MKLLFLVSSILGFSLSAHGANTTTTTKCYWATGSAGGGPISEDQWKELKLKRNSLGGVSVLQPVETDGMKYSIRAQLQYAEQHDLTLLDYTISKEVKTDESYVPLVVSNAVFVTGMVAIADDGRVALKCE